MKAGRKALRAIVVFGLMGVAASAPIAAQEAGDREIDLVRAAQLEAEAETLMTEAGEWRSAEKLLREAASLRPVDDVAALETLRAASKIAFYRGYKDRAIEDLENIAERAQASGAFLLAAEALADAAWIARAAGYGSRTLELADRAQQLANSPALESTERELLRDRFLGDADIEG